MVTICIGVTEQKSFENVNSCDIETKVKGHPLTLADIFPYSCSIKYMCQM